MNRRCDQLLTRASLSQNQHLRIRTRCQPDLLAQPVHARALPEQGFVRSVPASKLPVLLLKLAKLQAPLQRKH
jgi:hypothetical protein